MRVERKNEALVERSCKGLPIFGVEQKQWNVRK
jgi:hypothetical protein